MKEGIHPNYQASKTICACGSIIETRSTRAEFSVVMKGKNEVWMIGP